MCAPNIFPSHEPASLKQIQDNLLLYLLQQLQSYFLDLLCKDYIYIFFLLQSPPVPPLLFPPSEERDQPSAFVD